MLESNTLFIRHLPSELSESDKEEMLKTLGAIRVKVMADRGKMKHTAFATFSSCSDARHALSILHQKEIFNRCLVVEFAKEQHQNHIPHFSDFPKLKPSTKETISRTSEREIIKREVVDFSKKLHGVAPSLGLEYLPSPLLKYKYPPPTQTILQNINNALASVPKFYTQVLHLMNKMNLPAPFGPLTPAPPLAADTLNPNVQEDNEDIFNKAEDMEITSSEEESEFESDEDDKTIKFVEQIMPQKRPLPPKKVKSKKRKLTSMISKPQSTSTAPKLPTEPSEVFESQPISHKKISMKNIEHISTSSEQAIEPSGGFGAIEPVKSIEPEALDDKNERNEEIDANSEFISLRELRKKTISSREMKTMSIFRNYSPGEPTVRLYIKNLAKQVEEKDLRYIFGRFLNAESEEDKKMFDVRLMKEGRMKGQAFVTLATEKQAKEAVKWTNGFVLHTKPLVVQFARSAKPKEEKKKS